MFIQIDSKEPPAVAQAIKQRFPNDDIRVEMLSTGDLWADDVIIERKTLSDLLASIADGRLLNQAAEMRARSEHCYLVICGPLVWDFDQKVVGTGWHFRRVQGALLSVQELGVCVVHTADNDDYASTVAWILARSRDRIVTLWPRKFGVPATKSEEILCSLTDVGPERATRLLEKFGSVADALAALTGDVELPVGVGPKTRASVRVALGLSDKERLVKGE
jgi:DNA excision repair protein ERCC-4